MADKKHSDEIRAKMEKELADLRNRKQQIDLALANPKTLGTEYTVEELEKENVTLQNEITRLENELGQK